MLNFMYKSIQIKKINRALNKAILAIFRFIKGHNSYIKYKHDLIFIIKDE
jgi:hypothetical protein